MSNKMLSSPKLATYLTQLNGSSCNHAESVPSCVESETNETNSQ